MNGTVEVQGGQRGGKSLGSGSPPVTGVVGESLNHRPEQTLGTPDLPSVQRRGEGALPDADPSTRGRLGVFARTQHPEVVNRPLPSLPRPSPRVPR